jgi:hypothetical protein
MKNQHLIIALVLVIFHASSWAINKCTGADGKVAFQDAPCSGGKAEVIKVRPASGDGSITTSAPVDSANPPTSKPQTEAQRLEGQIAESQAKRKRQEYELRFVPEAYAAIDRQRTQCDAEIKELQHKKLAANNNLAGATWEGSISTEMASLATRCNTKTTELRDNLETLKKECKALGGCKL